MKCNWCGKFTPEHSENGLKRCQDSMLKQAQVMLGNRVDAILSASPQDIIRSLKNLEQEARDLGIDTTGLTVGKIKQLVSALRGRS